MELAHAQPKLFDTEQARGRKLQTDQILFEIRGHASTRSNVFALIVEDMPCK